MFGAKDENDFIKRTPGELSPKKQPDGSLSSEKAKQMIEKAMKDGKAYFEWTHKRIKGEEFPATVLLTKVRQAGKEYLQATVRDLSKVKVEEVRNIESTLKNKEEEIKRKNPKLYSQLSQLKKKADKIKEGEK